MIISNRQIERMVKKMSLRTGDVLLVKSGTGLATTEVIGNLIGVIEKITDNRVAVLVVDNFEDMKMTDHKILNSQGWFHVEALARMVRANAKGEKVEENAEDDSNQSG